MSDRIADIRHALDAARSHLSRCEAELSRWEEPNGGDHRRTLDKLRADVKRAENDVELLRNAMWAAESAFEAFEV
jgi:hypothetical protein